MLSILIRPVLAYRCGVLEQSITGFREMIPELEAKGNVYLDAEDAAEMALHSLGSFRAAVLQNDFDRASELAELVSFTLGRSGPFTQRERNISASLCAVAGNEARRARERSSTSRRTKCAAGLAVRLLPPADRARYRQEFAAELADLPRCDQAPYAFRLVSRTWSLRRSLKDKPPVRSTKVVVVVGAGACSAAGLASVGWPAAFLGSVVVIALAWTISSADRTRHLATLIRTARKK